MTEQEWLSCNSAMAMMNFLIGQEEPDHRGWRRWISSLVSTWLSTTPRKYSDRRKYLLACGMLRQWVTLSPLENVGDGHVKFSNDLQIEEEFADGLVSLETLLATNPERRWHWPYPWHLVSNVIREMWIHPLGVNGIFDLQSKVFRDIFGNPFRPAAVSPSWQTSNVVSVAHAIYDDRAFDGLPVLADALEDAGCTNQEVLAHCRGPGPHVRGCWALDLVLGKE